MVDKKFCMSSYLIYRYVVKENVEFFRNVPVRLFDMNFQRTPVADSDGLEELIKSSIHEKTKSKKVALMLSGGIDSAILARFLPEGTKAYTLQCVSEHAESEVERAGNYAKLNRLDHEIIDISWEDYQRFAPVLMKHKGAPIHSIEVQIYKAALQAKKEGIECLIFGENADIIYGGMDGLLKKDWAPEEFVERYTYVDPKGVLRDGYLILEPFLDFVDENGKIDFVGFIQRHFYREACGTYTNACSTAGVEYFSPYTLSLLAIPLDLSRIRGGDTKYIVRELYQKLYPDVPAAKKLPMPRPMDDWLKTWKGPVRAEFLPKCTQGLSGDQKWMVYALEEFLNIMEEQDELRCDCVS